jgi:hypothetical protein
MTADDDNADDQPATAVAESVMGDRETAQAVKLVHALRHQLREMADRLAWVERQDVTARNSRARAMRSEAAALRRDIREAEVLIDRLQRRYPSGDARTQQRPAAGQSRATVYPRAATGR